VGVVIEGVNIAFGQADSGEANLVKEEVQMGTKKFIGRYKLYRQIDVGQAQVEDTVRTKLA